MRDFHTAFLLVFSLTYVSLLAVEIPLLIYYPLVGKWSFTPLNGPYGPAMTWYGLVLASLAAGLLGGTVGKIAGLSARLTRSTPRVALFALAACLVLMRDFFLPIAA